MSLATDFHKFSHNAGVAVDWDRYAVLAGQMTSVMLTDTGLASGTGLELLVKTGAKPLYMGVVSELFWCA